MLWVHQQCWECCYSLGAWRGCGGRESPQRAVPQLGSAQQSVMCASPARTAWGQCHVVHLFQLTSCLLAYTGVRWKWWIVVVQLPPITSKAFTWPALQLLLGKKGVCWTWPKPDSHFPLGASALMSTTEWWSDIILCIALQDVVLKC